MPAVNGICAFENSLKDFPAFFSPPMMVSTEQIRRVGHWGSKKAVACLPSLR